MFIKSVLVDKAEHKSPFIYIGHATSTDVVLRKLYPPLPRILLMVDDIPIAASKLLFSKHAGRTKSNNERER